MSANHDPQNGLRQQQETQGELPQQSEGIQRIQHSLSDSSVDVFSGQMTAYFSQLVPIALSRRYYKHKGTVVHGEMLHQLHTRILECFPHGSNTQQQG